MRLLAVLIGVTALQAASQGGVPAVPQWPTTGVIAGRVVDGATGRPISDALVAIPFSLGASVISTPVMTDASGRFIFENLPAGDLRLNAGKAGYVGGAFNQSLPTSEGQSVRLAVGQRVLNVVLRLWRLSAINGTVTDENGDPVAGLSVYAYPRTIVAGRSLINTSAPTLAQTDDRGIYRLRRLAPGTYVVGLPFSENAVPLSMVEAYHEFASGGIPGASLIDRSLREAGMDARLPGTSVVLVVDGLVRSYSNNTAVPPPPRPDGSILAYQASYYSGATLPTFAESIELGSGDERNGVDFQLKLVPTTRVSGTVIGPDGPAPNVPMWLVPAGVEDAIATDIPVARSLSDSSGAFTFLAVPPGSYEIRAVTSPIPPPDPYRVVPALGAAPPIADQRSALWIAGSGGQPVVGAIYWGRAAIVVGQERVRDLQVRVRRGYRVSGTVDTGALTTTLTTDQISRISLSFERADGRGPDTIQTWALNTRDGAFTLPELAPGKYVARVSAPKPSSVLLDGRDVVVSPLDIVDHDLTGLVLTLAETASELWGVVRKADGGVDPNAAVIVFPADSKAWVDYGRTPRALRRTRSNEDGIYMFTGLPGGDYFVVAVPDDAPADWRDPKYLERLAAASGGMAVTVAMGAKAARDVMTVQVR